MKTLKFMLNKAINIYDRFRSKPHTKLTFIIVCAGVVLSSPSWWDRIFALIEKILSQNPDLGKIESVSNTNDLYFLFSGLFLVVFGIVFYVFFEKKSKRETTIESEKKNIVGIEFGVSDSEKRERDIKTITKLLSNINTETMDYFVDRGKLNRIINNIFYYWEGFRADYVSSGFHAYDVELREKIDAFYKAWGDSLSFGEWFTDTPSFKEYRFMQRHETGKEGWKESNEKFIKSIYETESTFFELLNYMRNEFEEIDLNILSKKARQDYIEYHRDLEEQ